MIEPLPDKLLRPDEVLRNRFKHRTRRTSGNELIRAVRGIAQIVAACASRNALLLADSLCAPIPMMSFENEQV